MKKRILLTAAVIATLVLLVLSISACSSNKLSKPAGLRVDDDTLTLKWSRVVGAYSYEVSISGEEETVTTTSNSLSLEYLQPGHYEIKVRALGIDPEKETSKWESLPSGFDREEETGLKLKLVNGRTEYEVIGPGSAKGDIVIPDTYRKKPVTAIAEKAFANNKNITSVTVGNNVKTIGNNAFIKCPELTRVVLSDSVTSIGECAFQSCKKLSEVVLSNSLETISPYAFSWCSAITEIKLGSGTKEIGKYAFSNCEGITSVTVSSPINIIGEYAFSDCKSLKSIDLSKGIGAIDTYAFSGCAALENLTLGEGIIVISDMAFTNCAAIKSVKIPDSTVEIGAGAFSGCTALSDVSIGENIRRIGFEAFAGTEFYDSKSDMVYLGGWVIAAKDKSATVHLTSLEDGVYGIADGAFMGCGAMKTVSLANIKYIGDGAFNACSELTSVRFDNSLLTIGEYSFAACDKLTSVYLGESITSIGGYAFYNCSSFLSFRDSNGNAAEKLPASLVSIGGYAFHGTVAYSRATDIIYVADWAVGVKPGLHRDLVMNNGVRGISDYFLYDTVVVGAFILADTVEYIGRSAFYQAMFTNAIQLPASLKSIGDYAFYGCASTWFGENGITVLPEGTEYIGRSAFYDCAGMVGLVIPSTVKTIGDYAFSGCINLGEGEVYPGGNTAEKPYVGYVIIEDGVQSIGNRAFQNCQSIVEIAIPDSVTSIGTHAFYKCAKLENVSIGSGLDTIPMYAFYKCESLKSVTMADSVKVIGDYAFRGCEQLSELKISKNTEVIGNNSFYGCSSLNSFYMPSTVTSIGNYALRGCSGIETLIIPNSVQTIGKYAFYGMSQAAIFCEAESASEGWNAKYNGSYRPVIFGCELSDNSEYVISFNTENINNKAAAQASFAQIRDGYSFMGWSTDPAATAAEYVGEKVIEAPIPTKLYSVWSNAAPETN